MRDRALCPDDDYFSFVVQGFRSGNQSGHDDESADKKDLAIISGRETAVFEGDRIALLRDDMDPAAEAAMGDWMAAHGAKLQS